MGRKLEDVMGVKLEHNGNVSVNWVVTTSVDGKTWSTALFDSSMDARNYARDFVSEHSTPVTVIAEAVITVNTADFLDKTKRADEIGITYDLWLESQIASPNK